MKNITIFIGITVLGLSILLYSIVNSLSVNPLSLSEKYILQLRQILPQDWGFFSKNPREGEFAFFEDTGNKLNLPNANLSNAWGISRKGRAQGTEAGLLYRNIKNNSVLQCNDYLNDCIKKYENRKYTEIVNKTPNPTMCGRYKFFELENIPFAWAESTKEKYIAKKYYKVDVTCKA